VKVLERGTLFIASAATLATLLFAALNGLAPTPTRFTLGLALWAGFLALYCSALPLVALLALASRRPAFSDAAAWFLRGAAGAFLLAAGGRNLTALRGLASLPAPTRFQVLCPLAVVLCLVALLLATLRLERRRGLRLACALTCAAVLGAFLPQRPGPAPVLPPVRPTPPLLVIGLDGADWRYLEPLLAKGELPRLAALRSAGAWGPLATMQPTLSPVVWTTMVTGRLPQDHGVDGFLMTTLAPVDVAMPAEVKLPSSVFAGALVARLAARGLWRVGPVGSEARRVPTLWNLTTAYGVPIAVVGWWATTDPEPVQGALVSAQPYYAVTEGDGSEPAAAAVFPARLYPDLLKQVMRPADVPFAQARAFVVVKEADWAALARQPIRHDGHLLQMLPYTLSLHETTRRLATATLERTRRDSGRDPDLMVLFRLVDMVCHKALVDSNLIARPAGEEDTSFTPAVAEAYRTVDRAVGELVDALPGANVVVVSDHGFDVVEGRRGRRAHHERAPDGIFIGAGPAFRPGRVAGLGVLDVMPLLVNLKGLPQARDFAGRLPERVLSPDWAALRVPEPLASYAGLPRGARAVVHGAAKADAGEMEGLRALGYIN
jgi:hypothetical protein